MEDDGNSSNNTNDKNDTAEIIQGGETSHIIKNDANNIMNNKKRTRTDEYEDSIFGNPWKDIKSGTTAIMAANILQELNRKYGNRNNNKNNFYNNYRNNRGQRGGRQRGRMNSRGRGRRHSNGRRGSRGGGNHNNNNNNYQRDNPTSFPLSFKGR